jgi:serine/threonine protein phosphatase PrpC
MLTIRCGSASDVGRLRPENQDSLFVGDRTWIVADGMGGQAAGGLASRLALESLRELDGRPNEPGTLAEAIATANESLLAEGRKHPQHHGMGTTVTGIVLLADGRWAVLNVGDSRVYRFAAGELTQLTVDHSAVQELVEAGLLSAADALHHPRRNIVTRSLGTAPGPRPDIAVREPVPGERFLICSDGLTNELIDAEIAEVLRDAVDAQAAADELVARAIDAGGRDNVTVIVLLVDGPTDANGASAANGSGGPAGANGPAGTNGSAASNDGAA